MTLYQQVTKSTRSILNNGHNTGRFNDLEFMLTHLNHVPRMADFRDYVKRLTFSKTHDNRVAVYIHVQGNQA